MAWKDVCTPKWVGGLGLPDFKWMNVALRVRWLWLRCTDGTRPWAEFDIKVPKEVRQVYQAAVFVDVGNGRSSFFWEDRWMCGFRVQEIAPKLYDKVRPRVRATRTVSDALGGTWPLDLGPDLQHEELLEYLVLWEMTSTVELQPEVEDVVRWAWDASGCYSVRTAYASRFAGREHDPGATFTWQSRAPLRCKLFSWLTLRNRCWTSDRLATRGLPHQQACPMCDQAEESMDHLLVRCPFARSVWFEVFEACGAPDWMPTHDQVLLTWCTNLSPATTLRKDLNSIVMLTMWLLWKHRNDVVFEGASPSAKMVLSRIVSEGRDWQAAWKFKDAMTPFFQRLYSRALVSS